MIDLPRHISKLENRHRNETSATIVLALRCWQAYRFLEPMAEMRAFLARANHAVIAAHRRNLVHIKLYMLTIFIAIEAGHYDSANGMLDKAMGYKSFLKSNEPFYYGVLCFLYAYLEINQKRIRSAKKHRRALTDHIKSEKPSPNYSIMQGLIHLAAGEFPEAYKFLNDAYIAGSNSIFMYEGLYRYYKTASRGVEGMNILPVLTYAAMRGADISDVAARYSETLSAAIKETPKAGERLYEISKYPPILKDICANLIANNDTSPEAYAYYHATEKRQIYTPGLFGALIRAAYENKSQKINHYPIKKFLTSATKEDISNPEFAVYVYHFLLTDPALNELLPKAQNKIMKLGVKCLENGIHNREANSIYYYLWSRFRALEISGTPLEQAEEILGKNLTLFEIRTKEHSNVKFIYITEPEKRGMDVYEFSENELRIPLVSENVSYTCLGAGQRAILDEEIEIKPMIGQANPEIYLYFFEKGDRRFHLLAYLANHYLEYETPPEESAPIFEALLSQKSIAKSYKMRILAALGRLHYIAENFDKSLECYGEIDENAIDENFIGQVLNVFLQTQEFDRAAKLISAKSKHISNETLFESLKNLLPIADESIAEISYNLLVNGYFSEELLAFVLQNYKASYSEWANLLRIIDEDNLSAPELDARVLESALNISCYDMEAQKAFTRMYAHDRKSSLVAAFTEFSAYEMLANSTRPNYDVLGILEKIFEQTERPVLLAWGLAGIYLRYNITTFKSDEIIRYAISAMENEGILFPVFKENATAQTPFIEKFRPFLYKSRPDKDCRLYYRIDDSKSFASVPMQYVRYGIYVTAVPMFYNESFTYYFSEEMSSGSLTTKEENIKNSKPFIHESEDEYFAINNAIIYEQMFKHDKVEKQISNLVKDIKPVRAQLL
ncbi:MAG: DUF5717 family protein [Defluviitaleaceae bacterium]|nr:DUF5717 family protein [Defluviitaleaceae bacterium]